MTEPRGPPGGAGDGEVEAMATHKSQCAWCKAATYCSADEHTLGAGACCYDDDGPGVSFCSVACFVTLRDAMVERARIAQELHPEWPLAQGAMTTA